MLSLPFRSSSRWLLVALIGLGVGCGAPDIDLVTTDEAKEGGSDPSEEQSEATRQQSTAGTGTEVANAPPGDGDSSASSSESMTDTEVGRTMGSATMDGAATGAIDAAPACPNGGSRERWYPDADGDGFGDARAEGEEACSDPSTVSVGYLLDHTDCNDADADVYPQAGYCLVQQVRSPTTGGGGDRFGHWILAVDDEHVLVAAPYAPHLSDPSLPQAGAIYELALSSGQWQVAGSPLQAVAATGTGFGFNVAYDAGAGVLAVGIEHASARAASGELVPDAGMAELFERSTGGFVHRASLTAMAASGVSPDPKEGGWFGDSVGFHDGDLLVTQRSRAGVTGGLFVFRRDSGAGDWRQVQRVEDSHAGAGADTDFGFSLAMLGNYAFIGAQYDASGGVCSDRSAGECTGAVHAYVRDGGTYRELPSVVAPAAGPLPALFGISLATYRDRLLVGAPGQGLLAEDGTLVSGGAVYQAKASGGGWDVSLLLKPGLPLRNAQYGYRVAADMQNIAVGVPGSPGLTAPGDVIQTTDGTPAYDRAGAVYVRSPAATGAEWSEMALVLPESLRIRAKAGCGTGLLFLGDYLFVGCEASDSTPEAVKQGLVLVYERMAAD